MDVTSSFWLVNWSHNLLDIYLGLWYLISFSIHLPSVFLFYFITLETRTKKLVTLGENQQRCDANKAPYKSETNFF